MGEYCWNNLARKRPINSAYVVVTEITYTNYSAICGKKWVQQKQQNTTTKQQNNKTTKQQNNKTTKQQNTTHVIGASV